MSVNESTSTLTPGQNKAILFLLQAGNIKEASRAAKIGEATLHRYLKDKQFIEAYREARRETLEIAIRKLESIAGEAINTLEEIMTNKENTAGARAGASKVILEFAFKVNDNDVLERVERLEESIKNDGNKRG